jgi:endonuclease YncB( thermonuclease family)
MPLNVNFNFTPNSRKAEPRTLIMVSDGDTPQIQQPVRAVSCDTPEKAAYAGTPPKAQAKLNLCRDRLENGFFNAIPQSLRTYIVQKIKADAAERHIGAALRASEKFTLVLEQRLTKPDGSKRKLGIIPTGEIIDVYGRLLAYFAPWYANTANDPLPPKGSPQRDTFNLNMIANGWAAFFPIYPSLPKDDDFNIAIAAAVDAWDRKLGQWAEFGSDLLLGYEYRMCIKLATNDGSAADKLIAKAFQRVCVDLRTKRILGKFGFGDIPPPYRLWVWENDLLKAKEDLGLIE